MTTWKIDSFLAMLRNPRWQFAIIFVVVLLSRLPFLDAGYGVNVDGWRVARVAREIATTGEYSVSRFPGYPVQEIVCSWFWRGGPSALNGLSAICSAIAATVFAGIARKLNGRDIVLIALALAATPIFYISSVCSKDYIWAIAFVLLAIWSALHNRPLLSGMFLGIATGCRITSLSTLLPIAVIFFQRDEPGQFETAAIFAVAALLTAVLAFSPVWLRYGTGFFHFYQHQRPNWLTILSRGTMEIWGLFGLIGLAFAACALLLTRREGALQNKWIAGALVLWIAITIAQYLRLPDQAGYLLPVVPALLLLAQQLVPRRVFQFACICLLLSPFVDFAQSGVRPGAIVTDRTERIRVMEQIEHFLAYTERLPGRNTIVVGAWEPIITTVAPNIADGRNHYVYLLDARALAVLLNRHEPIFYAPRMREFNYRIYGLDLANYGAIDLSEIYSQRRASLHAN